MKSPTKFIMLFCALGIYSAVSAMFLGFVILDDNTLSQLMRNLAGRMWLLGIIGGIAAAIIGVTLYRIVVVSDRSVLREFFDSYNGDHHALSYTRLFVVWNVLIVSVFGVHYLEYHDLQITAQASMALLLTVSTVISSFFGVLTLWLILMERRLP